VRLYGAAIDYDFCDDWQTVGDVLPINELPSRKRPGIRPEGVQRVRRNAASITHAAQLSLLIANFIVT